MNIFNEDLKFSVNSEGLDFWRECYDTFFPGNMAVIRHSQDGDHQRAGIDATVIMPNSKTYRIDEKLRRGTWSDILLEEWSDHERHVPGWVCKSVLSDFVLYAVPEVGKAYLMPCTALQTAWARNADTWRRTCRRVEAHNRDPRTGRTWTSLNWAIPENVLFPALGQCLRANFEPATTGEPIRGELETLTAGITR